MDGFDVVYDGRLGPGRWDLGARFSSDTYGDLIVVRAWAFA